MLFTGELNVEERNKNLKIFKSNKEYNVLLINSNVGSEGLTLTEASNVIFLNEWWNPSSNRQAEDRVNRIGQTLPVNFYILRSDNTIDENIGRILETKTKLESNFVDQLLSTIDQKVN